MLSVADIPLFGFHFVGIIGVILLDNREYRIATYLGARPVYIGKNTIRIKQGKYTLLVKLMEQNSQPLHAPEHGRMNMTKPKTTKNRKLQANISDEYRCKKISTKCLQSKFNNT